MKRLTTVLTLTFVLAGIFTAGVFADDDAVETTGRSRGFRHMHRSLLGGACVDADEDGLCDRCGEAFVDEDGDGRCDTCAAGFGRGLGFVDEDGDGVCDNGGGAGFVDEDGDGVCDNALNQGEGRRGGRGKGNRRQAVQ